MQVVYHNGQIVTFSGGLLMISTDGQYIEYDNEIKDVVDNTLFYDNTTRVRKTSSNNSYVIDITITSTGFDGVEDTDWTNIIELDGSTNIFRNGVRNNEFIVDGTITPTGFSGSENIDWENLFTIDGSGAFTLFRDGVRNLNYVIDKTLSVTGFDGTEDVDWQNLLSYGA